MEENVNPGYKKGLTTGLVIGAIVLVIVTISELVAMKYLLPKAEILDNETIQKVALLEKSIDTYYYDYKEEPATLENMREGLLHGVVDSLNDPYAEYLNAEELKEQFASNEGVYYGVGAYVSINEDEYPVFTTVIENTPAEAAGVHDGDIIVEVEGESVWGMSLTDVVALIKGDEGTNVHIKVYRETDEDYVEFDIKRGAVPSQTVRSEVLEDNIGYIRVLEFDGVTVEQFAESLQEMKDQNVDGLLIDLRSNPGGLLQSVLRMCNMILPEGVVVYTENNAGEKKYYTCDGFSELEIPLVVLINEYSASASEIFAGAVKDHGVGKLVGKTSYGKGIVQNMHLFSDNTAIKLTESAYFTPNGNYIQGTGIEPDVEIELDREKYLYEGIDTQLDKAIEVLKKEIK